MWENWGWREKPGLDHKRLYVILRWWEFILSVMGSHWKFIRNMGSSGFRKLASVWRMDFTIQLLPWTWPASCLPYLIFLWLWRAQLHTSFISILKVNSDRCMSEKFVWMLQDKWRFHTSILKFMSILIIKGEKSGFIGEPHTAPP